MSLQIVSVIGNATKDAESKVSKDGVSYTTFRLAVSGSYDKPTFYSVVVFGHYGEVLKEHIQKGRKMFVSGKLEISEKGYVSVVADHIELLSKSKAQIKKEMEEKTQEKETKEEEK